MRFLYALLIGMFILSALQADAMVTPKDEGLAPKIQKHEMCIPADQVKMPFMFY